MPPLRPRQLVAPRSLRALRRGARRPRARRERAGTGTGVSNGLWVEWEGQAWLIAEGTAPGFRIGVDRLRDEARLMQFQYVQRPRDRDAIFDLSTRRELLFQ